MAQSFDATKAAQFIAEAHTQRTDFENLPAAIAPKTVGEAYAAQEALRKIWSPERGAIAGFKIATTTKVMQELMGIDHPCMGTIYAKTVHASPAQLKLSDYIHMVVEFELAVRLAKPLPGGAAPYEAKTVRDAIATIMPAFELIEDRHAHYKSCKALSLIADNAWNAGIVTGPETPLTAGFQLDGIPTSLKSSGSDGATGKTDDPLGALAWIANLAVSRGTPLQAGHIIMTGSTIQTLPIKSGESFDFSIEGLGSTRLSVT